MFAFEFALQVGPDPGSRSSFFRPKRLMISALLRPGCFRDWWQKVGMSKWFHPMFFGMLFWIDFSIFFFGIHTKNVFCNINSCIVIRNYLLFWRKMCAPPVAMDKRVKRLHYQSFQKCAKAFLRSLSSNILWRARKLLNLKHIIRVCACCVYIGTINSAQPNENGNYSAFTDLKWCIFYGGGGIWYTYVWECHFPVYANAVLRSFYGVLEVAVGK